MEKSYDESYKEAVTHLWDWRHGGDSFYCVLYYMFQKADPQNYKKLSKAYPFHSAALILWNKSGDGGDDLFRSIGLIQEKETEND